MSGLILLPGLPEAKVATAICGSNEPEILSFFSKNDIELLGIQENPTIDQSISRHADISVLHLGSDKFIVDKKQTVLMSVLEKRGLKVIPATSSICGAYPGDIGLNFTVTEKYIFGRTDAADKSVTDNCSSKELCFVRQGYCGCSVLLVRENVAITDDKGIYEAMLKKGFEMLLVSKGDIYLQGQSYGFIGGASGKIDESTVVFFGDITQHRDFEKIISFLSRSGCSWCCTDKGRLRDIGGIIPVFTID